MNDAMHGKLSAKGLSQIESRISLVLSGWWFLICIIPIHVSLENKNLKGLQFIPFCWGLKRQKSATFVSASSRLSLHSKLLDMPLVVAVCRPTSTSLRLVRWQASTGALVVRKPLPDLNFFQACFFYSRLLCRSMGLGSEFPRGLRRYQWLTIPNVQWKWFHDLIFGYFRGHLPECQLKVF